MKINDNKIKSELKESKELEELHINEVSENYINLNKHKSESIKHIGKQKVMQIFAVFTSSAIVASCAVYVVFSDNLDNVLKVDDSLLANLTNSQTYLSAEVITESSTQDCLEESKADKVIIQKKEENKVIQEAIKSQEAQVKPSTGSVITAPEYKYDKSEDVEVEKKDDNVDKSNNGSNITVIKPVTTTNQTTTKPSVITTTQQTTTATQKPSTTTTKPSTTTTKPLTTTTKSSTTTTKLPATTTTTYPTTEVKPIITDGWNTISNNKYYYLNGSPVKGWCDISIGRYYFDSQTGACKSQLGIDVSYYQEDIDWNAVKNSGVEFAFIRVGFRGYESGKLCMDPKFVQNINGAKAAGIKCGVYFYSVSINVTEAVQEANFVLDAIKGYSLDLPIVVDTEHMKDRVSALSDEQRTTNSIAFMEAIKAKSQIAMLYTGHSFYLDCLQPSRLNGYLLWVAYYTDNSDKIADVPYSFWQYTDSGSVSGINGNVDMNVFINK